MPVPHIPAGCHAVTPYLMVKGAASAIEFYKNVFGATLFMRLDGPDGKIAHAEIKIGESIIMLADESVEMNNRSPQTVGGTGVYIVLYVPDVDAVAQKAVAAGAKLLIPIADQFYGDRSGRLLDPFGHIWLIATHTEDVSSEEMQKRFDEMVAKMKT
jgi:PhnB protein